MVLSSISLTRKAEEVAFDGKPFVGNPDNDLYEWWPNSEAVRTYMHVAATRGRRKSAMATRKWRKLETLLFGPMTDKVNGGWHRTIFVNSLKSDGAPK